LAREKKLLPKILTKLVCQKKPKAKSLHSQLAKAAKKKKLQKTYGMTLLKGVNKVSRKLSLLF